VTRFQVAGGLLCALRRVESNPETLAGKLAAGIKMRCGFEPLVLIVSLDLIARALEGNPFPGAEAVPSSLHLGFLASPPENPALDKLQLLRKPSEQFHLSQEVFYLHAPEGVGKSKVAASAERLIGVPMTVRNWRTVCKIRELAME